MSNIFSSIQDLIYFVFWVAVLVLSVFGFVDALRHRPDAFTAAGKASKPIWLAILGVRRRAELRELPLPLPDDWDPGRGRRRRLCG